MCEWNDECDDVWNTMSNTIAIIALEYVRCVSINIEIVMDFWMKSTMPFSLFLLAVSFCTFGFSFFRFLHFIFVIWWHAMMHTFLFTNFFFQMNIQCDLFVLSFDFYLLFIYFRLSNQYRGCFSSKFGFIQIKFIFCFGSINMHGIISETVWLQ